MQAIARARYVRVSPRKARAVVDLVRGKRVVEALELLRHTRRAAVVPVEKAIRSAAANARSKTGGENVDIDDLVLEQIVVDEGPVLKRWRPGSRGRTNPYRRPMSHITVKVSTVEG